MNKKRLYWLPINNSCKYNCKYCTEINAFPIYPREKSDIERSEKKFIRGNYDNILLPCNIVLQRYHIKNILSTKFPVFLINTIYSYEDWQESISYIKELKFSKIIVIIDNYNDILEKKLNFLPDDLSIEFWLIPRKELNFKNIFDSLQLKVKRKLCFYPVTSSNKKYFSIQEFYTLGQIIKNNYPEIDFSPPRVIEPFNSEIHNKLELEPIPIKIEKKYNKKNLLASIIIPTYNSGIYLEHCISHLQNQLGISKNEYEILIIDDGSTDNSAINAFEKNNKNNSPFLSYIRLYRPEKHLPGSPSFRAGVVRNTGVYNSTGKYLIFIDSDIIVSENFISKMIPKLEQNYVVQAKRYYLNYDSSIILPNYNNISHQDCYIPDQGYWHNFYNIGNGDKWNKLEYEYKYLCSYSMGISRNLFNKIGQFRKTFSYYGFEDTELGYRLKNNNARFFLLDEIVYHLEPSKTCSEYNNDEYLRNQILKHSARWFYKLNFDPKVYEHFQGMF